MIPVHILMARLSDLGTCSEGGPKTRLFFAFVLSALKSLQCFDAVGWAAGRASDL